MTAKQKLTYMKAGLKLLCVMKFYFLISQPKHMLWVHKRTVSMRQFFWAPRTYVKVEGQHSRFKRNSVCTYWSCAHMDDWSTYLVKYTVTWKGLEGWNWIIRPPDKTKLGHKIVNIFISISLNICFWVLKRTISLRRFFWVSTTYIFGEIRLQTLFCIGYWYSDTLANSEDPDEMPLKVAFYHGLHCLLG